MIGVGDQLGPAVDPSEDRQQRKLDSAVPAVPLRLVMALAAFGLAAAFNHVLGEQNPFRPGIVLFIAIVETAWFVGVGFGWLTLALALATSAIWSAASGVFYLDASRVMSFGLFIGAGVLVIGQIGARRRIEQQLRRMQSNLEMRVADSTQEVARANESLRQQIAVGQQNERELLAYQGQLHELAAELSQAEERERQRVAARLHDEIGQSLSICQMHLESLRDAVPSHVAELVAQVIETLDLTIARARTITCELSPPVLRELGLVAAIQWLAEQAESQGDIRFPVDVIGEPAALNDSQRVLLFQVARELIANVAKHSRARRAQISLTEEQDVLRLCVDDDGVGLDESSRARGSKDRKRTNSFGLFSIRERLRHCGGRLEVLSPPGGGTNITAVLPLTARAPVEGRAAAVTA